MMPARARLVHDLLSNTTERHPHKAAYVDGAASTSYEELEQRAAAFCAGLQERGVRKGDRVALVLDGAVDYLVAWYGILKAGAVVVPACPDARTRSLRHLLSHSDAAAVVLEPANFVHVPDRRDLPLLHTVVAAGDGAPGPDDRFVSFGALESGGAPVRHVAQEAGDLAAIIYTSGTTGAPKGVMLAHRNLTANIASIVSYLDLGPSDVVAMTLPFYYVYGNSVLHTHVAAGGTIVQAGSMAFPARVVDAVERFACTGLPGVPSTFARLLQSTALQGRRLESLRYVTQAGGPMSPALTEKLRAALPHTKVVIMYGQTEASARLAWLPPEDLDRKPGSAGRAIPGVELAIVDPEGRALPPGQVGEIVARGDNVMLGYWRAPEESAKALRPEGLRTGDLGRMDEEGFLYIVGRGSDMIKSGAHRIGPREVEDAIETLPEVSQCAVVGVPDVLLGESIVAFLVPSAGCSISGPRVMQACLEHLPRFKLPAGLRVVDDLPRTATGKLDRLRLKDWFTAGLGRRPD